MASIAGLLLLQEKSFATGSAALPQDEVAKLNYRIDFARLRFSNLIDHLQKYLDKNERLALYENVGESCASDGQKEFEALKGNLKGILDEQVKQGWLENYDMNESTGTIKLSGKPKDTCGCPLLKKGLTPSEFCNCSIGYMKKMYSVVTGKKVDVTLESSILMGGDRCNFSIKLS